MRIQNIKTVSSIIPYDICSFVASRVSCIAIMNKTQYTHFIRNRFTSSQICLTYFLSQQKYVSQLNVLKCKSIFLHCKSMQRLSPLPVLCTILSNMRPLCNDQLCIANCTIAVTFYTTVPLFSTIVYIQQTHTFLGIIYISYKTPSNK